MKIRLPLYTKILLWFLGNVLLIAVLVCAIFRFAYHIDLQTVLNGRESNRIAGMSELVRADLETTPKAGWDAILERFGKAYGVEFLVFRTADAVQLAGKSVELPPEVRKRVQQTMRPGGGPPGFFPPPPPEDNPPEGQRPEPPSFDDSLLGSEPHPFPPPPFGASSGQGGRPNRPGGMGPILKTENPVRYWFCMPFGMHEGRRPPVPMKLVVITNSLHAQGLLMDFAALIGAACGALLLSALFWLPLVRGITRAISQMTLATGQIAEGHFEVRVPETRGDELGLLGQSVNRMAVRLSGLVSGQKRFLGDVAHELCSPIARTQMALGILEQRADASQADYLADLREEVQTMSGLVNELLSFSKASLGASMIKLSAVELRPLVERAIDREGTAVAEIEMDVPEGLYVLAEPQLLLRSVGNLMRNAIRYAGEAGLITVTARRNIGSVTLVIADCGKGIPEESLPQIFDPFYRADTSRTRETGGVGLGMAIVKTCVESCSGTVTCQNRVPTGLEVTIKLKIASAPELGDSEA